MGLGLQVGSRQEAEDLKRQEALQELGEVVQVKIIEASLAVLHSV